MTGELAGLTDAELHLHYRSIGNNLAALQALNQVLSRRDTDLAFDLYMQVAADIARLRPKTVTPAGRWLKAFLISRSLSAPDGRALHRYRMTDDEYRSLATVLLDREGRRAMEAEDDQIARLFVLYAAEWFRREAVSLFRRWNDVAPGVVGSIHDNHKRALTNKGLAYWKRPLIIASDGSREFIISLSLQGGIPANVVLEDSSASLGGYLRLVMRQGLQDATLEHLITAAQAHSEALPPSYRYDDFIRQCAELAERLLYWRRQAEASGLSVDPVVYLDKLHPEWRRDLPIYVPAGQDSGLTRLLNGLMREKLSMPYTTGISARRLLILKDGRWQQALRLAADGEISKHRFPSFPFAARVGIVPSGHLADQVPGDFAVAYPPDGDQVTWRIRPRIKLLRPLTDFEFASAVTVNLVEGGSSVTWTWPGGEAVSSDLCVFEADDGSGAVPEALVLKARGSYSSMAKTLYLWAPDSWRVEGADVTSMGSLSLRRPGQIYRLDAVTYVIPDDDETRFRIEPGSANREERLRIPTINLNLEAADTRIAFAHSPLPIEIETHGRRRAPKPGEVFWRRPGERWQPYSQAVGAEGLIEISWRDPQAGVQIEKQCLCLVPSGARIEAALRSQTEAVVNLDALDGWSLSLDESGGHLDSLTQGNLRLRFHDRPIFRVRMRLQPPQGQSLAICLPVRAREAVIIGGNGRVIAPGSTLDLPALRGARLLSQGTARLQMTTSTMGKGEAFDLTFSDEYPLASLRSVMEEMLATAGEQDAKIKLVFLGDTRPPIWVQRYRYERPEPTTPLVLPAGGLPVARMVCQPKYEHALTAVDGGYILPEACVGPTLVYLRDGPDILSRPLAVSGPGDLPPTTGHLRGALTERAYEQRQKALDEVLQGFASEHADFVDLEYFNIHIAALNGVPATAFDALKRLGQSPEALTRVLVHGRDAIGVEAVWKLQNELPFLWLALPVHAWRSAFHAEAGRWLDDLRAIEPGMRLVMVKEQMLGSADRVIACDAALATILTHISIPFTPGPPPVDVRSSANAYIARFSDHPDPAGLRMSALPMALARAGLALPEGLRHFSLEDWGALAAPGVLAAAALGKLQLNSALALALRRVLRDAPDYVSQAYSAFFNLYR